MRLFNQGRVGHQKLGKSNLQPDGLNPTQNRFWDVLGGIVRNQIWAFQRVWHAVQWDMGEDPGGPLASPEMRLEPCDFLDLGA